jgi:dipeptidyl aminopeptidase/acylaminoacyl peptidase
MTSMNIFGRALAAAAPVAFALALGIAPGAPARAQSADYRTLGALTFDGIPPLSPAVEKRVDRYMPCRGTRFLQWLPHAGMLVAIRSCRSVRLARLSGALAKPRPLTSLRRPVPWIRSRGDLLAFVRRSHGHAQLYLRAGSAPARQVTGGDVLRGTPLWSGAGPSLAFYGAGPADGRGAVYIENTAQGGMPRLVVGALSGRWRLLDWSRDGRRLLLGDVTRPQGNVLYLLAVKSGSLERLPVPPARIAAARFAPGGSAIYLLSDQGGQFERLFRFDLRTHVLQPVSPKASWDVEQLAVSRDGRYVAYTVDEDGRSILTVIDNRLKLALPIPWLRDGLIGNMRFDCRDRLAFTYQSARHPPGVYVYDPGRRVLARWTAPAGERKTRLLAAARLIHYPTWDRVNGERRMISAYVYLPPAPGPAPVLILLHAGVHSQFRPRWRPFIQFVVNELGYVVIAPNVRGSSGYGTPFRDLADGRRRQYAVRDIGSLLVWIGLQPGFDVHHVVLMGRGYGGWLALDSLATFDGHLRGAIDVAGIADLADYVTHAPAGRIERRMAEFGDTDDPPVARFLRHISPLGEVQRIRSPVLIVQGLDGRGSRAAESRQLAYLLRFHHDKVWLLTAGDAGNDFSPPADRAAFFATAAQFLTRLAKKGAP